MCMLTYTHTLSYVYFLTTSSHRTNTRTLAEETVNTNRAVTLPTPPEQQMEGEAPNPRFKQHGKLEPVR